MTTKTIPVQVDGEAVRLNPCTIVLSHLNKAKILAKKKKGRKFCGHESEDVMCSVTVGALSINDYEAGMEMEFLTNHQFKFIHMARPLLTLQADNSILFKGFP